MTTPAPLDPAPPSALTSVLDALTRGWAMLAPLLGALPLPWLEPWRPAISAASRLMLTLGELVASKRALLASGDWAEVVSLDEAIWGELVTLGAELRLALPEGDATLALVEGLDALINRWATQPEALARLEGAWGLIERVGDQLMARLVSLAMSPPPAAPSAAHVAAVFERADAALARIIDEVILARMSGLDRGEP